MQLWQTIQNQLEHCILVIKIKDEQSFVLVDTNEVFKDKQVNLASLNLYLDRLPPTFIQIPLELDDARFIFICNQNAQLDHRKNQALGISYSLNKAQKFLRIEGALEGDKSINPQLLINKKHDELYRIMKPNLHIEMIFPISQHKVAKNIISYKKKNKKYFLEDVCIPILNEDREVIKYDGFIKDITDIMEIKKELNCEKDKLNIVLKHSSIGIWEWNLNENTFHIDKNAQTILGLKDFHFKGGLTKLSPIIHDAERMAFKEEVLEFLRSQKNDFEKETKILIHQEMHWILIRGKVTERDASGKTAKVLGSVIDLNNNKKMEQEIMKTIVNTQEEERKRFATDLHDGLGQYLAAIKMNFDALNIKGVNQDKTNQTIRELLDKTIKDLRAVSHNLMPGSVADLGLIMAIKEVQNLINNSYQIYFHFVYDQEQIELSEQKAINIYRIIQELVNNTIKHSGAKNIHLHLEQKDHTLWVKYQDDGIGLHKKRLKNDGIGMKNLKTRVFSNDGTMNISSPINGGFLFNAYFPLNKE